MRPTDFIARKRDGFTHTEEELKQWFSWIREDQVDPEQISAWLMAAYLNGMTKEELYTMTACMIESGDVLDLSAIKNTVVDKHSTGGVGDTTSLVLGPIVASLGIPMAKMSGRGLGHTGGTLDKLSAIPGLRVDLTEEEFIQQVNEIQIAIAGQTKELVPADGKLYALRDVTATVDSINLIASSIMSKKLAIGSEKIVLDVKVGSGAFMQELDRAKELARTMVGIGNQFGKETVAYITDMNTPLGDYVGNALEVYEAVSILQGKKTGPLFDVSVQLAAEEIRLAGVCEDLEKAREMAVGAINDGSALDSFKEMVRYQQGDVGVIEHPEQLLHYDIMETVKAKESGTITSFDALIAGQAALALDCGRRKKGDNLDLHAGFHRLERIGDTVQEGDVLVEIYTQDKNKAKEAVALLEEAIVINGKKEERQLIYDRITGLEE